MFRPLHRYVCVSLCSLLSAASGCRPGTAPADAGPPAVTVAYPLQQKIIAYAQYTGRTAAVNAVEVRARVSGYLGPIKFKDGDEVKQGTVLYDVDPRPYKATYDQADAQVKLQEANLKFQQSVYERDIWLYNKQAVAEQELQQALESRNTASAQVTAAKANLEVAKLNLDWTKVTAPIDGRLGRTLITRGNLITADQTMLTTIVSLDPMYVYFDLDEATVLTVQQLLREGKFGGTDQNGTGWPVYLGLTTEHGYPHQGKVDFSSNAFAATTATLQVRGLFANSKPAVGQRLLAPGMFVRVRIPISPPTESLLVLEGAVGADQSLNYVLTVDDQDRVVRKQVQVGTVEGGLQVITTGLTGADRVIVSGLQRAKNGTVVAPKLEAMPIPQPEVLQQSLALAHAEDAQPSVAAAKSGTGKAPAGKAPVSKAPVGKAPTTKTPVTSHP